MAVTNNPFLTPAGVKFGDSTVQTTAAQDLLPVYGGNILAGNIVTTGNVTAPGANTEVLINVAGNIGNSATFTYDYAANLLTAGNLSATGGVFGANANITGAGNFGSVDTVSISATGNIDAVSFNATGVSNLATIETTGITSTGTISTTGTVKGLTVSATGNVEATSVNATGVSNLSSIETTSITSTGTITAANISVTGTGAVIAGNGNGLSNLVYANIDGANANVGAYLASGNADFAINIANTITAANFIGNGSTLDGIVWANISGANANVQAYLDDIAQGTVGNVGNLNFGSGNISITGNTINGGGAGPMVIDPDGNPSPLTGELIVLGDLSVTGNLTYVDVETSYTSNLLWVAAGNANTAAAATGGGIAVGNITAGNVFGTFTFDGVDTWLSNINMSSTGNINAAGNVHGANVSTAGNVIGANVYTPGAVSAAGNVTGAFLLGDGAYISNINASNLVGAYSNANVEMYLASGNANLAINTGNVISAAGNITGANINTAGLVSATGNIIGNNLSLGNTLTATTVNYSALSSRTANATQQSVTLQATNTVAASFSTTALKGLEYTWIVESTETADIAAGDGMSMGKGFLVANATSASATPYGLAQVGANVILYPTITGDASSITFTFTTGYNANVVLTTTQFG